MKAILRFRINFKETLEGQNESSNLGTVYLEKEVSVPVLPSEGMNIDGFEIFSQLEELREEDSREGRLIEEHGQKIQLVVFELKGDTLVPVIWLWDDYNRTDYVGAWDKLKPKKAFEKFFKPQCEKFGFKIVHSTLK